MAYVPARFLVPWAGDQRPPAALPPPIPGGSKFQTSSGVADRLAGITAETGARMIAELRGAANIADAGVSAALARLDAIRRARATSGGSNAGGRVSGDPTGGVAGFMDVMPPDGIPFDETQTIQTPAAGAAEAVVLTFRVPFGLDGLIRSVRCNYTGAGWIDGSGDLVWRIMLSDQPARNFHNIRYSLGSSDANRRLEGGIRIYSDQLVQIRCTHDAASGLAAGPGSFLVAGLAGYFWPRKG